MGNEEARFIPFVNFQDDELEAKVREIKWKRFNLFFPYVVLILEKKIAKIWFIGNLHFWMT